VLSTSSTFAYDSNDSRRFLFPATFAPLIALYNHPTSPSQQVWQEDVSLAIEVLHILQEDPLAERCLRILDVLAPHLGVVFDQANAPGDAREASEMFDVAGLEGLLEQTWGTVGEPTDLMQIL